MQPEHFKEAGIRSGHIQRQYRETCVMVLELFFT